MESENRIGKDLGKSYRYEEPQVVLLDKEVLSLLHSAEYMMGSTRSITHGSCQEALILILCCGLMRRCSVYEASKTVRPY